jgi:hypothetical protein
MTDNRRRLTTAQNRRLRVALAAVLLVVLGLLIVLSDQLLPQPWSRLGDALGIAVATTGFAGLAYEYWLRSSTEAEMLDLTHISERLTHAGIVDVLKWPEIVWSEFFESHGGDIEVGVRYGATWAKQNAETVMRMAVQGRRRVNVILLDVDAPDDLKSVYASAFKGTVASLESSIVEATQVWTAAAEAAGPTGPELLQIERCRMALPYTFYRSGNHMWIVLNVARQGRFGGNLPAIKCRQTGTDRGLYDWVTDDIGACRRQGLIG